MQIELISAQSSKSQKYDTQTSLLIEFASPSGLARERAGEGADSGGLADEQAGAGLVRLVQLRPRPPHPVRPAGHGRRARQDRHQGVHQVLGEINNDSL